MIPAVSSIPVRITFYPDYRAINPYQSLLYAGLEPALEVRAGSIEQALKAQAAYPGRRHVFHLHWEHHVLSEKNTSVETFLNQLSRFKDKGGRVIWSIHNIKPHDSHDAYAYRDLIEGLKVVADITHMHSQEAVIALREAWNLPTEKIRIIAHPNYAGAYPRYTREEARASIEVPTASKMALLPGRIAAYKVPSDLVIAFLEVAQDDHVLVIAGKIASGLSLEKKNDPRIRVFEGHAPPDRVSVFHAAADFIVLPYTQSLTSGSGILAATLGRGVLGPDVPGLQDCVVSEKTGTLYDATRPDALRDALALALSEPPDVWDERGAAAQVMSQARDTAIISAAWKDLIAGLLSVPANGQLWDATT